MFTIDPDMPTELAPLAWLIGTWEGAGVVGYPGMESQNFGQEIVCRHDGRPFLHWQSTTWLLNDEGEKVRAAASEVGFWRPLPDDEVELVLAHPTGIVEMYYGKTEPAKIQLATDGIVRSPRAKEYTAATRLFGLVHSDLMWVMDMAAEGKPLTSHASAQLKRVE